MHGITRILGLLVSRRVMCVAKTARIMYAPDGLDEPSSLFRMVEAPPLTQFPLSHTYQSSTQALLVSKLGLSW